MNRESLPSEEEQYATYRLLAEKTAPESVIIRTLDIGGDKESTAFNLPREENPFLGCRALRLCLARPDIFETQLRAILRASAFGNIKILLPMVSGIEEIRAVREIIARCREQLTANNIPVAPKIDLGAMIEIPSAALCARWIAKEVDFFSIGTNDLIQYTIAVDRVNDRVAHLYTPTHPAILRLLKETADAAHNEGIWVGVCGEMAGEIALTPLLIGLGIDELSTTPSLVPRVKKAIQSLSFTECRELAEQSLRLAEIDSIALLSQELARKRYAELF
jgi:phosphotransferase system enzyme I (PtsI)